jgi:hypothetical protein
MSTASQSSPLHSTGSSGKVFLAVFAIAMAIYTAGGLALPDGWWLAPLAIAWGLASVMVLDHLHGSGEFSRLGMTGRMLPMFVCIAFAAGAVQDRFRTDGLVGWLAFGLTFFGLLVVHQLLARQLRPRYRGRGLLE